MGRLDSSLWGPSATLPDEPPIEDEQREQGMTSFSRMMREERIREQNKRMAAAVAALKRKEEDRA